MRLKLSPRLQRIADYVPQGSVVADVGTDHAYIPIWLLCSGVCTRAYATDLKPGPLENAAADAARAGVTPALTLLLCDGLALCPPDAVDTVILAGMGGETIQGILAASPWALERRLILQPQTKFLQLRAFLAQRGCRIADASLVCDTGRIYQVWLVGRGGMAADALIDPSLTQKRDPLLRPYTEDLIKRLRKQILGLEQAKSPLAQQTDALKCALEECIRIHKETETWRQ